MSSANVSTTRPASLADRLRGVRVLIVAPSLEILGGQAVQADLLLRNFRAEGVDVGFQPHNPRPFWPLHYLTKIKYVRTVIVSIFYVCGLLMRVPRYDVIHIFSASYWSFILAPTPAILISRLFGKKCILNYRSGEAEDHLTRWGKSIFWIIRRASKIIVPSGYLVDVIGRFGFRAEAIFNISDLERFRFRERKEIRPRVLVPRNLEPLYDNETAIRAFLKFRQSYPQAELTVTGYGSDEERLRRWIDADKIEGVTLTGRVERDRMPELFDAADIFLNASVIDNMPVAIVEAFYCGLPVVTTNAGGIPYIVRDRENGLVCLTRDVDALAAALSEIAGNYELRSRLAAAARLDAEKFSWPEVRQQWADQYLDLLGRP